MLDFVFLVSESNDAKPANGFTGLLRAVIAATLLFLLSYTSVSVIAQDISGGAGEGAKRPVESSTKRRPRSSSPTKTSKRSTKASADVATASPSRIDLSKQVDSALELGNAARDGNPPRYGDAEQAYKLALGLDPTEARAYAGLGNTYFDQKRYPEAEVAFVRAIELDPQDADALIALAYTFNVQERFLDAEHMALRAIALDANSSSAFVALGWSKFRRKNYLDAEVAYRRAIALSPKSSEIYSELGVVLMDQGRWRDSEAILLQAVTLDPTNAGAIGNYAVSLQKLGQLDKAAENYAHAIKINPTSFSPHSNMALIKYTSGDFVKAREEWETALRLNSTYPLDRVGLLILNRKLGEARDELEKYTQANALDEDGWLLLGDVRRMQSDSAGASLAYERAGQIAPDYAKLARPTLPEPAVAKAAPVATPKQNDQAVATVNTPQHTTESATQQSAFAYQPKLRYASTVRTVKATYNARPTPAGGVISVTCNPNAIVLVEPLGGGEAQMSVVPSSVTVVAFNQLRPGEYLVSATLDGFETIETRVFVAATKIVSIKLVMRPKT